VVDVLVVDEEVVVDEDVVLDDVVVDPSLANVLTPVSLADTEPTFAKFVGPLQTGLRQ
jgi:hypothetical protein